MRFDVVTLFPELLTPFSESGVTRRAHTSGQLELKLWQLRDFADGRYRRVDDRPFGGGPGMVMMVEPLARSVQAIRDDRQAQGVPEGPVVLFSPMGKTLSHNDVEHWASSDGAILVCGRYEGVDQRFIDAFVDVQISLGDFVLSGGEIAALALMDAVARLQPGVLGDEQSHVQDSFNDALDGLLDCPHYTRPETWRDQVVPQPLLSGHHAQIARWRRDRQIELTAGERPDLIDAAWRNRKMNVDDELLLKKLKFKL